MTLATVEQVESPAHQGHRVREATQLEDRQDLKGTLAAQDMVAQGSRARQAHPEPQGHASRKGNRNTKQSTCQGLLVPLGLLDPLDWVLELYLCGTMAA